MNKRIDGISRQLFRIGLVATAILMPLDLLTQGSLFIEWVVLAVIMQRPLLYWLISSKKQLTLNKWVKSSLPFWLPILAYFASTYFSAFQGISLAFTALMSVLLMRAWTIQEFIDKDDLRLVEKTILIVSSLVVAFGYWQFFGDSMGIPAKYTGILYQYRAYVVFPYPRAHSFAQEPLFMCNFLFLTITLLWGRLRSSQINTGIFKWYGLLYVTTMGLFLSANSRTALFGLIVIAGLFAWSARKELRYLKKIAWLSVGGIVLSVVIVGSVSILPRFDNLNNKDDSIGVFKNRVANINDASAYSRFDYWPKAITTFAEKPILGSGPNTARIYANIERHNKGVEFEQLQPINNDGLSLLAEGGIIGILSFLPLLIVIIKITWQNFKLKFNELSSPYVLALIAVTIQAQFFGAIALLRTWVIVALLFGSWRITQNTGKTTAKKQ